MRVFYVQPGWLFYQHVSNHYNLFKDENGTLSLYVQSFFFFYPRGSYKLQSVLFFGALRFNYDQRPFDRVETRVHAL